MLGGCANITEKELPRGHYDSYYGSVNQTSRFSQTPGIQTADHAKVVMQSSAPKRYVVKKGDTLWGIAKKFITKPWYWPEIWDKNQKIKNPHLIYPGDVLTLHYVRGSGGQMTPVIRVDRGLLGKPVSTVSPFLAWPRILDKATVDNSPYIVASRNDHHLIHDGETVYVKKLRDRQTGNRHAVYHEKGAIIDPDTGRYLGQEVIYKGYARVERTGALATAKILQSHQEIREGDRLLKPEDNMAGLHTPIRLPTHKVRGTILSLYDAESISGKYMVAAINRGKNHNMQVGHVIGIYTDGKVVDDNYEKARLKAYREKNFLKPQQSRKAASFDTQVKLPPEHVGNMLIYKVTHNISYGLIIESSREVHLGDKIGHAK
jgi:LysM repeat protein